MERDERRTNGHKPVLLGVVLTCALMQLTGCGNDLARVTGTITVDGEVLRAAPDLKVTVLFQPNSGGTPAVGIVDEDGQYQLSTGSQQGIVPGDYSITCTATQIIPSKTPGGTPGGRRITDPKYAAAKSSGLRFTVLDGDNQFDIALESPKALARPR